MSYQQTSYKKNETGFRAVKQSLWEVQAAAICITICSWGPEFAKLSVKPDFGPELHFASLVWGDISLLLLGSGDGDLIHHLNYPQSRLHWKRWWILNTASQSLIFKLKECLNQNPKGIVGLRRQGYKHGKIDDDTQVCNVEKRQCTL